MHVSIYRAMLSVFRSVLLRLNGLYLATFPSDRLSDHIRDIETNLRRGFDQRIRISTMLGQRKITYLDIGARGGLNEFLFLYRDFIAPVYVEPDAKEAESLKENGSIVIDKAIAGQAGWKKFYVTKKGGLCSLLKPAGTFLPYYKGSSDRFKVVQTLDILATTLGEVSRSCDLEIDILKVDTQGAELDILSGLGALRPLAIISEMSFVELYQGQDTLFELGAYLRSLGYLPFDLTYAYTPPPLGRKPRKSMFITGLPVHGDVCFIPDWTTEKGLGIIRRNELAWAAILLIYGLEDVLHYVIENAAIDGDGVIRKALKIHPQKRRQLKICNRISY